jgi:DNA-binding CsgD family transcriptional regulator
LFRPLAAEVDLSARELEVAQLLVEGLAPQAISDRLVVSVRTVENHIGSAYRKTGLGNRDAFTEAMHTWLAPTA